MEAVQIEILLEKYWEGESSLKEEQQLRQYFQSNNIDPKLKSYTPLFIGLATEQARELSKQREETIYQSLPLKSKQRMLSSIAQKHWVKIAACLALVVIGSFWLIPTPPKNTTATWQEDTYEDPQKAYEEVRQTLMLLSKGLNEGAKEVGTVSNLHQGTSILSSSSSKKQP